MQRATTSDDAFPAYLGSRRPTLLHAQQVTLSTRYFSRKNGKYLKIAKQSKRNQNDHVSRCVRTNGAQNVSHEPPLSPSLYVHTSGCNSSVPGACSAPPKSLRHHGAVSWLPQACDSRSSFARRILPGAENARRCSPPRYQTPEGSCPSRTARKRYLELEHLRWSCKDPRGWLSHAFPCPGNRCG